MNPDHKKSVIVGIFVAIALAILIFMIISLGGQKKIFSSTFGLKAVFENVGGLQKGNNVWYSGVKVGTVKDIHFLGGGQIEIDLNIEEKVREFIKKDSEASIGSDGLIGNKIIVISGGSNDAPPVEDGDRLKIKAPIDTDALMAKLPENVENLTKIIADLSIIIDDLAGGKGTVGMLLTDTVFRDEVKLTFSEMKATVAGARASFNNLNKTLSALNQEGTLFNKLITDQELYPKLDSTLSNFNVASERIANLSLNLETSSQRLTESDNFMGMMLNDSEFAATIKQMTENLESTSEKLDTNMVAIRHNFLFRRYFKRLEKGKIK